MPELPEVETVKNQLSSLILFKPISKIETSGLALRKLKIPDLSELVKDKFIRIHRRNKYLILESSFSFLVVHLGMTGQLVMVDNLPKEKHIHMIIHFSNGEFLYYQDVRRFGQITFFKKTDYSNYLDIPLFQNLGFEPLSEDFKYEEFSKLLNNNNNPAKKFLMEAKYVCGIGNIYANEILFLTKINPVEPIKNISEKQRKLLFKTIIQVLKRAVELGGSSISDFVHVNGASGEMQKFYKVYGKTGEPCSVCYNPISRIKQYGRSTFYCSHCQPLLENSKKSEK
jgi:formamidopyrimidine-DNA glycosylase